MDWLLPEMFPHFESGRCSGDGVEQRAEAQDEDDTEEPPAGQLPGQAAAGTAGHGAPD